MSKYSELLGHWRDLLGGYTPGEESIGEWCNRHGVTRRQFYYWRERVGSFAPAEGVGATARCQDISIGATAGSSVRDNGLAMSGSCEDRDAQRIALWQRRIEEFARSGLSMRRWSCEQGLPYKRLQYWRGRLGGSGSERVHSSSAGSPRDQQWLAVEVVDPPRERAGDCGEDGGGAAPSQAMPSPSGITLCVAGAIIQVERGFDAVLLRAVVRSLASERC